MTLLDNTRSQHLPLGFEERRMCEKIFHVSGIEGGIMRKALCWRVRRSWKIVLDIAALPQSCYGRRMTHRHVVAYSPLIDA